MYELIQNIKPYFFSLRETSKNVVSLDLKIPSSWKYDFLSESFPNVGFFEQDKNKEFLLLSIVSESTKVGYDDVFDCGIKIIQKNKEIEEKEKLLKDKIEELKKLFDQESLEKLKELEFLKHGQEDSTGNDVVE